MFDGKINLIRCTAKVYLVLVLLPNLFLYAKENPIHGKMPEKYFQIFDQYCLNCHDALTEKGSVNLEDLNFLMDDIQTAELWQKVLNSLNSGEMPPEDKKQLSSQEKLSFLKDLSEQMVIARKSLSDQGGKVTMRRLNQREYSHTIESLLGLKINVSDLPHDENPMGYDTDGSALFFSSDQFEQYLSLGKKAVTLAFNVKDSHSKEVVKKRIEAEDLMKEAFWKILKKSYKKSFKRNKNLTPPENISNQDLLNHFRKSRGLRNKNFVRYLDSPLAKVGFPLYNYFVGIGLEKISLPRANIGDVFKIKVKASLIQPNASEYQKYLEFGSVPNNVGRGEMNVLDCQKVTAHVNQEQILEFEYIVKDGDSPYISIRQRHYNSLNAAKHFYFDKYFIENDFIEPTLMIDWVEWQGPFKNINPKQKLSKILPPKDPNLTIEEYHKNALNMFAIQAFRGKHPQPNFMKHLFDFYKSELTRGQKSLDVLKECMAIILSSPSFIYLNEPRQNEEPTEISDQELAVRLSYFLWSTPPDETLLTLAREGKIKQPKVLKKQVERMIKDPQFTHFIESFTYQWLHMSRLDFFQFDYKAYPEFDDSTKSAARQQVYKTIHHIIKQNLPIDDLLKSNYAILNNIMADYYGLNQLEGEHFRPISQKPNSLRGGLLGMSAILAMGSNGSQTSPVERGAWVLRKLLHNPPPPAPPNIPQLSRFEGKKLGPRQIQKAHQEEPQCMQCHKKIDPIGFGLENFDATGLWRDKIVEKEKVKGKGESYHYTYTTYEIDPKGQLPGGKPFRNFHELQSQVAKHKKAFSYGFTQNLIAYSLGRPYSFSDSAYCENIIKQAANKNHAMSEYIMAIVLSDKFKIK